MRLPSFSRTMWKCRSFSWIAENMRTGTLTSPNEIAPDQIARGTGSPPDGGRARVLPAREAGHAARWAEGLGQRGPAAVSAGLRRGTREAALERPDRARA